VFLERLFMECQIQRSLTLKSLQSVGVVAALLLGLSFTHGNFWERQ